MQLELCSDITRLFDNKEFIKIFNSKKELFYRKNIKCIIKDDIDNKYYLFKIKNRYYGIDKEFYNNRFLYIYKLIEIKKIDRIKCINYESMSPLKKN